MARDRCSEFELKSITDQQSDTEYTRFLALSRKKRSFSEKFFPDPRYGKYAFRFN
jgi:hypothetical protein